MGWPHTRAIAPRGRRTRITCAFFQCGDTAQNSCQKDAFSLLRKIQRPSKDSPRTAWPVRLSVRTSGFQPGKRGSTPLRAATFIFIKQINACAAAMPFGRKPLAGSRSGGLKNILVPTTRAANHLAGFRPRSAGGLACIYLASAPQGQAAPLGRSFLSPNLQG